MLLGVNIRTGLSFPKARDSCLVPSDDEMPRVAGFDLSFSFWTFISCAFLKNTFNVCF